MIFLHLVYINAKTNFIAWTRSYVHAKSQINAEASLFLLFSSNTRSNRASLFMKSRVFRFCVAYLFLYSILGRDRGNPEPNCNQESCRDLTILRRRFCRSYAGPLFIHIRGKNNPWFPCLFSRGEKIRGLEYYVYKTAGSHRCSCRGKWCSLSRGREREGYSRGRLHPCFGWSTNFFPALVREECLRRKDYEEVTKLILQKRVKFHFANITNKVV